MAAGGETIFALASGALPAAVAIVRISGPEAFAAAASLMRGPLPPPRRAALRRLVGPGGERIDEALVLGFPAPASFTGEDVAELQVSGSPAVVARIEALLAMQEGCRAARPGEFARRAFLNGRMDLTQAEALAELINAETEAQRAQAMMGVRGGLRSQAEAWRARVLALRADAEAGLDFADHEEDVALRIEDNLRLPGAALAGEIDRACDGFEAAQHIRKGVDIAVIGPPNAGKSTLINALARSEVAIVSPVPGTTRDIIEVPLALQGRRANLIDTAGLRETSDPVECEGVRRAKARAREADIVLYVSETGDAGPAGAIAVQTKADLGRARCHACLSVSALDGTGMDALIARLCDAVTETGGRPDHLVTTGRQLALLRTASHALRETDGDELLLSAEALRRASNALGELTGHIAVDEMLDHVFGRFCIGK